MEPFLAALVICGGATAVLALAHQWKRHKVAMRQLAQSSDVEERDLDRLRPGDVLVCDGRDYLVDGVAECRDGTRRWWEARLSDAGAEAWVVVEKSPPAWLLLGTPNDRPAPEGDPSSQLDRGTKIFSLDRRGTAKVNPVGDMGENYPVKSMDYARYKRAGNDRVWLRRADDDAAWLTVEGEKIPRHMVTLLPGE